MLNKKGQALVEFILVLPILIILLLSIVDFGKIYVEQNRLETKLNLVNNINSNVITDDLIYNVINKNEKEEIKIKTDVLDDGFIEITLEKKINIITPGLNLILKSPYTVKASMVKKYG